MAVFFWYLGKSDLSSVHVYSSVDCTSHFLQGTRKTRPCLTDNAWDRDHKFSKFGNRYLNQGRVREINGHDNLGLKNTLQKNRPRPNGFPLAEPYFFFKVIKKKCGGGQHFFLKVG